MSELVNRILHGLSALLFRPFGGGASAPWGGLVLFSVVTAVLGLMAFKYTSRQRVIMRVRSRLMAHILELRLYQDDLWSVFHAFGALLLGTGRYLLESLLPVAVLIVPLGLWLGHMAHWLEWRPLQPGESTILTVTLAGGRDPSSVNVALDLPDGLQGDAQPFVSRRDRLLAWRLHAIRPLEGELIVSLDGQSVSKRVSVAKAGASPVFPERPADGWLAVMLAGPEGPVPSGSAAASVRLEYPAREWHIGTLAANWMAILLALTIGVGLVLKRPLKVVF